MNGLSMSLVIVIACGTYGVMMESFEDFTARAKEFGQLENAPLVAGELDMLKCQGPLREEASSGSRVADTVRIERDWEDERIWSVSHEVMASDFADFRPDRTQTHTTGRGDDARKDLDVTTRDAQIKVSRDERGIWMATFQPNTPKSVLPPEPMVCIAYRR